MYFVVRDVLNKRFSKSFTWTFAAIIGTFFAFWPTLVSGLDSHHDGLVIVTINMTKAALFDSGVLPFNQYGPVWSFLYAVLSLPFSSSSTLIVARIITLVIYILTFLTLRQIAKAINLDYLWPTTCTFLLLTQPWTIGYGTTFLAWPSALSTFLLTLITYLVVRIQMNCRVNRNLGLLGILAVLLIFTRFQIGFASFLISLVFVVAMRDYKKFTWFISSFLLSITFMCGFLQLNGWLGNFIFDDIQYSVAYVQDQYAVNPFPLFTILISVMIFLSLILLESLSRKQPRRKQDNSKFRVLIPVTLLTLLIIILTLKSPGAEELLILITRRFWIGGTLGLIVYLAFKNLQTFKSRKSTKDPLLLVLWLFVFGGVGMIQIYPLFDQVHFWWGLSPIIIPICFYLLQLLIKFRVNLRIFLLCTVVLIGTTTVLVPSIQSSIFNSKEFVRGFSTHIRVSSVAGAHQNQLQDFFRSSISENSRVANLCHNSDVFFDTNLAHSSSRYFIYWPPFTNIQEINSDILNSNPDVVVTCSQTQIPAAAKDVKLAQEILLANLREDFMVAGEMNIDGTIWRIYK